MKTLVVFLGLITAVFISGCAKESNTPAMVMVTASPPPLVMPPECTNRDPAWVALPDQDIRRDAAARNYAVNRRQYSELLGRRRICRESILAQIKKG